MISFLLFWGTLIVGFFLYCYLSEFRYGMRPEPSARKRALQMKREARRALRRVDQLAEDGRRDMARLVEERARASYVAPPVYQQWIDAESHAESSAGRHVSQP